MFLTFITSPHEKVTAEACVDEKPYAVRVDVEDRHKHVCSWTIHCRSKEGAMAIADAFNEAFGIDRAEKLETEAA